MILVTKSVENYRVISPDGILLRDVTEVVIRDMTDQSYVCDLYADDECVAHDRRFAFSDMICDSLTIGEIGLIVGELPTVEWSDAEIKMYLDCNAIEYMDETGIQLLALIPTVDTSDGTHGITV